MKTPSLTLTIFVALCVLSVTYAAILELGIEIAKATCRNNCISEHNNDNSYSDSYLDGGFNCHCYSKQADARTCRQTCIDKYGNSAYFASYIENGSCLCKSNQGAVDQCRNTCVSKYSDDAYKGSYIDANGSCLCKKN